MTMHDCDGQLYCQNLASQNYIYHISDSLLFPASAGSLTSCIPTPGSSPGPGGTPGGEISSQCLWQVWLGWMWGIRPPAVLIEETLMAIFIFTLTLVLWPSSSQLFKLEHLSPVHLAGLSLDNNLGLSLLVINKPKLIPFFSVILQQ